MTPDIRVIVAHPGRQHALAAAIAADELGMLDVFVTGSYVDETRLPAWMRLPLQPVLRRRTAAGLDPARVMGWPGPHLLGAATRRLASRGIDGLRRVDRLEWGLFDLRVARLMRQRRGVTVLHAFEGVCARSLSQARRFGIKVVLDVPSAHEYYVAANGRGDAGMTRLVRRERELADVLLAPSELVVRCLVENGVEPTRIALVPYAVDTELFHPGDRDASNFRLLFVGRGSLRKGVDVLLDAWGRLMLPDAELVLLGGLDAEIRRHPGLALPGCRHVEQVAHADTADWLRSADALVLPSRCDSWGLVVTEAMASGLPVIVSDATGAPVHDGVDGFRVPVGDAESLAERIRFLAEHPLERRAMGAAGRAAMLAGYTREHYRERLAGVYTAVLSATPHEVADVAVPEPELAS